MTTNGRATLTAALIAAAVTVLLAIIVFAVTFGALRASVQVCSDEIRGLRDSVQTIQTGIAAQAERLASLEARVDAALNSTE